MVMTSKQPVIVANSTAHSQLYYCNSLYRFGSLWLQNIQNSLLDCQVSYDFWCIAIKTEEPDNL